MPESIKGAFLFYFAIIAWVIALELRTIIEQQKTIIQLMTKQEAYQEMLKGNKVRHVHYSPHEWATIIDGQIQTEEGYRHGSRFDEFWSVYQQWPDGWELFQEPEIKIITVEMFINWYCHPEAIKEAEKVLKRVWKQNVLMPGVDFEVNEFLDFDLLNLELERLVCEMESEQSV